jgi:hypothetical protein
MSLTLVDDNSDDDDDVMIALSLESISQILSENACPTAGAIDK